MVQYLEDYSPSYFDNAARTALTNIVSSNPQNPDILIRIVGQFDDENLITIIRPYISPQYSNKVRWSGLLAMSRLGAATATASILDRVGSREINDDWIYYILPDIIYTKNKTLIDLLVEQLYLDDRNCLPGDPDATSEINCAFRILESLAPIIEDFPIGTKESGDLDVRNYRRALETARSWFTENPDYKLVSTL